MKFCITCKIEKSYEHFNRNVRQADGHAVYCKQCRSENYQTNRDKRLEYQNKYNEENRENQYAVNKLWKSQNKHITNALGAARRAKKLQATPEWLTSEERKTIRLFFLIAKQLEQQTGIAHHVDHIVPLQGVNVSGLHVPWNLQVLTADENVRKLNKFNTEAYDHDLFDFLPDNTSILPGVIHQSN